MKIFPALLLFTVAREVAAATVRGIDNDDPLSQTRRKLMTDKVEAPTTASRAPVLVPVVGLVLPPVVAPIFPLPTPFPTTVSKSPVDAPVVVPVLTSVPVPTVPLPTPFPTRLPPTPYPTGWLPFTEPTPFPTGVPPTSFPTGVAPAVAPVTAAPVFAPVTVGPPVIRTRKPLTFPTKDPSLSPSDMPVPKKAELRLRFPTPAPSPQPSSSPTIMPTDTNPSISPSLNPSFSFPTPVPSPSPSVLPTHKPPAVTAAPSTKLTKVNLPSIPISTNGSNYDPAALLLIYNESMANELEAAGVTFDSLEFSIDLLGKDNPTPDSDASLKGSTSQIVVITGYILVQFQNIPEVEAWFEVYVQTATRSSFMIALFQALNAVTGGDTTWESSEASPGNVPVTLSPTTGTVTIACPSDSASFESDVVVDFAGYLDNATEDQLLALEQAFLESYNSANTLRTGICDLSFRVVTNVTIVADGSLSRRLQQKVTTNRTLTTFKFRFRVTGSCRGCAKSTNLFNDALRRTLLVVEESTPRLLQITSTPDGCVCPADAEVRGPSANEFSTIFQRSIITLQEAGMLTFIQSIVDVPVEVDPVECSTEVDTFETDVALDFFGNPDAVTENEWSSLETAFQSDYNKLIQGYCDPLFRSVAEVNVIGGVTEGSNVTTAVGPVRFLQTLQSTKAPTNTSRFKFKFVFRVTGMCRGCKAGTKLFNDALRLKLRRSLAVTNSTSVLEDSNNCFCPTDSIDFRSPSTEEFTTVYNQTVNSLSLPNVVAIVDVVLEVVPVMTVNPTALSALFVNTSSPISPAPTTNEPVLPDSATPVGPTIPPTKDPTATPTKRPTTVAPSNTDEPSFVPSSMPSSIISAFPSSSSPTVTNCNVDKTTTFMTGTITLPTSNPLVNATQAQTLSVSADQTTTNGKFCMSGNVFAETFKPPYNFAIVIDVSGSTFSQFEGDPVGDVNQDGFPDTILDAEIASVLAFLNSIASNPNSDNSNVNIGLISFSSSATLIGSFDPLNSTNTGPNPTLVMTLKALQADAATDFDDGLDKAVDYFNLATDVATRTNVLFFLSDGIPNIEGDGDGEFLGQYTEFDSEFALLNNMSVARLAIGVGRGSVVSTGSGLDKIDNTPDLITGIKAQQVTTTGTLTSLLLANPVVGTVTSLQVKVNGVVQPGITAADVVSGPTGFTFGSVVLSGLNTAVGFDNTVETTVTIMYTVGTTTSTQTLTTTNKITGVA